MTELDASIAVEPLMYKYINDDDHEIDQRWNGHQTIYLASAPTFPQMNALPRIQELAHYFKWGVSYPSKPIEKQPPMQGPRWYFVFFEWQSWPVH
jgi:hypothetical protein